MEIRKGQPGELEALMGIVGNAIANMLADGLDQWDALYPTKEILAEDLNEGSLYVYVEDKLVKGFIILNEYQEKEYKTVNWEYKAGRQLVIHRLCTDPQYKRRGIATALVRYAEQWARQKNYTSLRLDAFVAV